LFSQGIVLTRLVSVITGKLKEFPVEAIEKRELV
jgi:hypothetical protein